MWTMRSEKTPAFMLYPCDLERYSPGESAAVSEHFGENASQRITDIPRGSVVVPRFRMLPFGRELQSDVEAMGAELVNSYHQHRNVADIFAWCHLLDELTAPVYDADDGYHHLREGAYIVKGETNSLKNDWFGSFYAPSLADLPAVVDRVHNDGFLSSQRTVIRPFQDFRQIGSGVDGRPVFHERRVFVLDGAVISEGFYWSSHPECSGVEAQSSAAYSEVLDEAVSRTAHLARFYVIDMSEHEDGRWSVVELNDGVMAGLSDNDADVLWGRFLDAV